MLSLEWIFIILDDVSGILYPVNPFRHLKTFCRGLTDQAQGAKDMCACVLSWKSGIDVYSILEKVLTARTVVCRGASPCCWARQGQVCLLLFCAAQQGRSHALHCLKCSTPIDR